MHYTCTPHSTHMRLCVNCYTRHNVGNLNIKFARYGNHSLKARWYLERKSIAKNKVVIGCILRVQALPKYRKQIPIFKHKYSFI